MSEHKKERREGGKVKSKFKKDGIEKNKKTGKDQKHKTAAKTLALLADESVVNPTLSSLFAAQVSHADSSYVLRVSRHTH